MGLVVNGKLDEPGHTIHSFSAMIHVMNSNVHYTLYVQLFLHAVRHDGHCFSVYPTN